MELTPSDRIVHQEEGVTLIHGDCREMKEVPMGSVDLIVTDPPFNVSLRHGRRDFDYGQGLEADALEPEDYALFTQAWLVECLRTLKPGGQLYALMPLKWLPYWAPLLKDLKWHLLPWNKTMTVLHRMNTYLRAWEPILWIVRGGAPPLLNRSYTFAGDKDWLIGPSAIGETEAPGLRVKKRHPTPRPNWLYEYLILRSSAPGSVVLDPMMGSGTGAWVARNLGRQFIGYDINRDYVDLATTLVTQRMLSLNGVKEDLAASEAKQLHLMQRWESLGAPKPLVDDPDRWVDLTLRLAALPPDELAMVGEFLDGRTEGLT